MPSHWKAKFVASVSSACRRACAAPAAPAPAARAACRTLASLQQLIIRRRVLQRKNDRREASSIVVDAVRSPPADDASAATGSARYRKYGLASIAVSDATDTLRRSSPSASRPVVVEHHQQLHVASRSPGGDRRRAPDAAMIRSAHGTSSAADFGWQTKILSRLGVSLMPVGVERPLHLEVGRRAARDPGRRPDLLSTACRPTPRRCGARRSRPPCAGPPSP